MNTKQSRRQFMTMMAAAGGGGALMAGLPLIARADLECRDIPLSPSHGWRECTVGLRSQVIHESAVVNDQQQSQWCWAACIAMAFQYDGYSVPQNAIVQRVFGEAVNMPGQPHQILSALNGVWQTSDGGQFESTSTSGSTSPELAAQDLERDRPLIIGTMGHAMLLTAMSYRWPVGCGPMGCAPVGPWQMTGAIVRDPWPGRGRRQLSGQEWMNVRFAVHIRTMSV